MYLNLYVIYLEVKTINTSSDPLEVKLIFPETPVLCIIILQVKQEDYSWLFYKNTFVQTKQTMFLCHSIIINSTIKYSCLLPFYSSSLSANKKKTWKK